LRAPTSAIFAEVDRWRHLVKHLRAESLEKRLLAERARLREDLAVEPEEIEASDVSGRVAVELAEIAQLEKELLALNAEHHGSSS